MKLYVITFDAKTKSFDIRRAEDTKDKTLLNESVNLTLTTCCVWVMAPTYAIASALGIQLLCGDLT